MRHLSCKLTDRRWITPPEEQDILIVNVAPPVSGQMYDMFTGDAIAAIGDATEVPNVRLIHVATIPVWTVQPTPLTVNILLDNLNQATIQANPASGTAYQIIKTHTGISFYTGTAVWNYRSFLLEGRSCRLGMTITGGTVSNLYSYINYATWPL